MRNYLPIAALIAAAMSTTVAQAATVMVVTTPDGADVVADGTRVGTSPCRFRLEEGAHTLVLTRDGCENLTHRVMVGRKLMVVELTLRQTRDTVDVYFKEIGEDTMGWLALSTKGQLLGEVPGTLAVVPGRSTLVLVKDGYRDARVTITEDAVARGAVEVPSPSRGLSSLRRDQRVFAAVVLGQWDTGRGWIEFEADGSYRLKTPYDVYSGEWSCRFPTVTFKQDGKSDSKTLSFVDGRLVGRSYAYDWNLERLRRVPVTPGKSPPPEKGRAEGVQRFVGTWLKWDTGSRLIVNADRTYHMATHDNKDWRGTWTATATSLEIQANGKPLALELQTDGTLRGRASNGWVWKLRKTSGPAAEPPAAQVPKQPARAAPLPTIDDATRRRCERMVKDLKDGVVPGMMRPRFDAIRRNLQKSLDREITLETRTGKKAGQLAEVNDADVVLQVQIRQHGRVLGSSRMTVKFLDLTPGQLDELDAGWRDDPDVLALMAVATGDDPTPHMTTSAASNWIRVRRAKHGETPTRTEARREVDGPASEVRRLSTSEYRQSYQAALATAVNVAANAKAVTVGPGTYAGVNVRAPLTADLNKTHSSMPVDGLYQVEFDSPIDLARLEFYSTHCRHMVVAETSLDGERWQPFGEPQDGKALKYPTIADPTRTTLEFSAGEIRAARFIRLTNARRGGWLAVSYLAVFAVPDKATAEAQGGRPHRPDGAPASLAKRLASLPTRSVLGYWSFDAITGKTVNDGSARRNRGVAEGTVTFEPGVRGRCADLSEGQVNIQWGSRIHFEGSFSVDFWVKLERATGSSAIGFGINGYGALYTGNAQGFTIRLSGHRCRAGLWMPGQGSVNAVSNSRTTLNKWTHVAAVVDAQANTIALYIDGRLAEQKAAKFSLAEFNNAEGHALRLGGTSVLRMIGSMDEVRLWGAALTDDQIAALHEAVASGKVR